MSSQNESMIAFKSMEHELTKVEFNKLPNVSSNYKVRVKNEISPKSIDASGFTLNARRHLFFEPKGAFEIRIEYDITCTFDRASSEFYNGNLDDISKLIEKRKIEIFNSLDVGNLMSILISQISLANNYKPLIVPPYIETTSDHEMT